MEHTNGRIGSMSYNIISDDIYTFVEGIEFILAKYPYYDRDKLRDNYSNMPYSVQMIEKSISNLIDFNDFLKIVIFDIIIGNSDRHHSNWGIKYILKDDKLYIGLCPLYDNGSSLCAYEDLENVKIFFKDKMKFEALVNTKSKSAIGWEGQRPIRHFELLRNLKESFFESIIQYIEKIKNNINENSIDKILNEFDNNIISEDMKELLKSYIIERRKRMLEIYDLKDEV